MTDQGDNEISFGEEEDLLADFVDWTNNAVVELRGLIDVLPEEVLRDTEEVNRIYDLTHNIKGMGTSFDFQLLTHVGVSLCRYLKGLQKNEYVSPKVIQSHIRTFEVIMEHKIRGGGGDQGTALLHRLEAIIVEETS